ncbi:MAG: TlpA family protein disulfide reductase, partial [Endomicrobium sp.]|nr:TlpA family protein disulfide reductase [Endomicrobium sp.]
MRIKIVFALLCIFSFSGILFAQAAPDFALLDTNGNLVKLSDFKGKTVFLDFWASWCPPCRESIPAVKNVHKQFLQNQNVVIIGVNLGEKPANVISFVKKNAMKYPVLLGDKKVSQNYGVNAIPAFFII